MNAEEREIQRTIWREQEAEEIAASKMKMSRKWDIERGPGFNSLWDVAWIAGRERGLSKVEMYFGELAELMK